MAATTAGPRGLYPDTTFVARDLVPEALIFTLTTNAGGIEGDTPVVRVPYVSADAAAAFVPEGQDITAVDPTLAEVTVSTGKIAVLTKVSREAASYQDAANLMTDSLRRSIITKANAALLTSASAPTGLLATSGVVDGGTLGDDDLDVVAEAITSVEVNGGTASHIVMDPASFGVLRVRKVATGSNLPLLGAPGEPTGRTLFGVPVIVSSAMTSGKMLIIDSTNIISASGVVTLATSEDLYFQSDSRAVRVTWRIGWKVIRPNRMAKITVTIA
ncbi:phage major capsid protein [Nakamurella sp.]|uniref:phage major capsid protein n=1 Tax=Nakamurella sp. TaxID=1869182 RepID=UPI003784D47A